MKKVLAVLALAIFIGGVSAPVIASNNNVATAITLNEDDPKKKETKKETKKAATKSDAKSSSGCQGAESKPCSKECGGKEKK